MTKISNRIKTIREANGLERDDVSKQAGITSTKYSRIENGTSSPTLEEVDRISKVFGVSPLYLQNDRVEQMENKAEEEEKRLLKILENVPSKQLKSNMGLVRQAARLRVLLDDNWQDILENGEYEKFSQSDNQIPYDRKRPIVETYDQRDKTYQSIIKQLTELIPQQENIKRNNKKILTGRR